MPVVPMSRRVCRRKRLRLLVVTGAALVAAVVCAPAGASPPNAAAPRVVPPLVIPPVPGVYETLAVRWWQYALGQPTATNPLTDPTGANCAVGQSGPVFFLAGTAGSGTVDRTACVVHGPHALFFPLVNAFDVHTPGDGLDTPALVYDDFVNTLHFRLDTAFATLDGVPVRNLDPARSPFRACAAPVRGCFPDSFSLTFPADNLFGLPAGVYAPAVQDGIYLLLAPLTPGRHTLHFGGSEQLGNPPAPGTQDITYELTVTR